MRRLTFFPLLGLALVLYFSAGASAAGPGAGVVSATSRVSYIGSFKVRGGTLAAAIRSYGQPARRIRLNREACRALWPKIGLRLDLYYIAPAVPCRVGGSNPGRVAAGVVSAARPWRTTKGLRLGDSLGRLKELYPNTKRFYGANWGLVPATDEFFSGYGIWWLSARIVRGNVAEFHLDGGQT